MSRPTRKALDSGVSGWDALVNDNEIQIYDRPFPMHIHTGDQTDIASTFAAASYDQCFLLVDHTVLGHVLYFSNGTSWELWAQRKNLRTTTGAVTMVADDGVILCDDDSGNYDVDLPPPADAKGRVYQIKRIGASDVATVVPNVSEDIDGAASFVLAAQYQSVTLTSDGTDWFVL